MRPRGYLGHLLHELHEIVVEQVDQRHRGGVIGGFFADPVAQRGFCAVAAQVGAADDRAGAIRLCAAAAGGFDCMPVTARR